MDLLTARLPVRSPVIARFRHTVSAFAAVAASTVVASCSGDRVTSTTGAEAPQVKVEVRASTDIAPMMVRTPAAERGARGGTTLQLDASVFNPNGKELEHKRHVYWTSLDTLVATVDTTGLVTAQDTGKTFVVVDHKKGVDSVRIVVAPVPVASVSLTGGDSLSLDDTTRFVATPLDSAGVALEGRMVSWASLATTVATVSSEGEVVAVGVGSTDISATSEGKSASQLLRVWPQPVATLTVDPEHVSVPQFQKVRFTATARDRRGKALSDRVATWSSSDPAIFYIKANADTATGKDVGTAVVTATVEGKTGTSSVTVTHPVEARALWVTRFEYTGPSSVDFAKIGTIFQRAASANFNVVYFQVRSSGDALYFSDIEPCSPRMCGSLGGPRPGQDPLDVALAEAAKYGIEVHAWLNAYTGFISGSTTACSQFINSSPSNWLKGNPTWSVSSKNFTTGVITRQVDNCSTTSEYMWVSPGVPEIRAQLARVAADVARRYGPRGLRGIHLDRIRYPGNTFSYDSPSQEAFRTASGSYPASNAQSSWLDFRRGFVNQGVQQVYDSVRTVDPTFVISAAVFPGYKPRSGWSANWSFTDLFQDPQAWAVGGYLDVEVPMNYPATSTSASWTVKAYCSNTDWTCVLDDHIDRIERQSGRQVYVGVGAIKGWVEMEKQINLAHDRSATGVSVYSYSQVDAIPNGWTQLAAGPFKNKATVPGMGWKR
jgi:uncharacterized lipoprotein YddW (UPF0748 family)